MTLDPEQLRQLAGGISAADAFPEPELVKQLAGGVSVAEATAALRTSTPLFSHEFQADLTNPIRLTPPATPFRNTTEE